MAAGDLKRWRNGGNHHTPHAEWQLYGFCVNNRAFELLRRFAYVLPTFDPKAPLDLDAAPLGSDLPPPQVRLVKRPNPLRGLRLVFPLGISASVLTRNSKAISFYASRGYDILTYRDRALNPARCASAPELGRRT